MSEREKLIVVVLLVLVCFLAFGGGYLVGGYKKVEPSTWRGRLSVPVINWVSSHGDSDESALAYNLLVLDLSIVKRFEDYVKYGDKVRIKNGKIRKSAK